MPTMPRMPETLIINVSDMGGKVGRGGRGGKTVEADGAYGAVEAIETDGVVERSDAVEAVHRSAGPPSALNVYRQRLGIRERIDERLNHRWIELGTGTVPELGVGVSRLP